MTPSSCGLRVAVWAQPRSTENGTYSNTTHQDKADGVRVTALLPGVLDAWLDFAADGDWTDPDDQVFAGTELTGLWFIGLNYRRHDPT